MEHTKAKLFILLFLLPIYSYTQVHVSGNISGYWENVNEYIIDSDITILENDTLTVQEGTIVKINSGSDIIISGLLDATGTENLPITFTSYNNPVPGDWGQIRFTSTSDNNSVLSYCIIEYGGIQSVDPGIVNIDGSNPTIENCELRHIDGNGIYFEDNSSSLIKNNTVHDFTLIGIWADWGNNSPLIENNIVFNGYKGIKASSSTSFYINANIVYDMSETCIDVANTSEPIIINNCLFDSFHGITVGEYSPSLQPYATISNNYIFNNTGTGIYFDEYADGIIQMNIIINNDRGVRGCDIGQPSDVSYNLVWNNNTANYQYLTDTEIGQIVTINNNDIECDVYFNISCDPDFEISNNENSLLSSSSPSIDSGNDNFSLFQTDFYGADRIIDGNNDDLEIIDIGPYEYNPFSGIDESGIKENGYELFPNPSEGLINIKSKGDIKTIVGIQIFDINGKSIHNYSYSDQSGIVDIYGFTNGIYLIRIATENDMFTTKIIKR